MNSSRDVAKRVGLAGLVAGFVVLAAIAAGTVVTPPAAIPAGDGYPEYAPDDLATEPLENSGIPDPSGEVGTVVFDRSNNNRFQREDVAPLADAITRAGGEVLFTQTHNGLETTLFEADVLVVVDPATSYDGQALDALEQFLENGGRVVIFGEPNRKVIERGQFGGELSTQRSQLTTLGSTLGITFDTQYLSDQQHNDGNFKNVLVGPPDGQDHDLIEGVEDVALYTATSVAIDGGEVLLRTAPSAEQAGSSRDRGYPVAVVNDQGNALAVGDKTFLRPEYASVGDNDVFIERIVEFMAGADHQSNESAALGTAYDDGFETDPDGDLDQPRSADGTLDRPLSAANSATTAASVPSWAVDDRQRWVARSHSAG